MTGEQWNAHWYRIYQDLRDAGALAVDANEQANRECVEQFGPEPEPDQ